MKTAVHECLRATSSLPEFAFLLWLAQPLLQSSETMTNVSYALIALSFVLYIIGCVAAYRRKVFSSFVEIFGTKRDFLYDLFIAAIALMVHYSTGYYYAADWWMVIVAAVLGLTESYAAPQRAKRA